MCLDNVTNWCKEKSGFGYKVFRVSGGILSFWYDDGIVKEDKWMKAVKSCNPSVQLSTKYEKGFHLYKTKTAAFRRRREVSFESRIENRACVKKVLYKGLIISGETCGNREKIIVADKIKVLKTK